MALHEWRDPITGERKWLTDEEYAAVTVAQAKAGCFSLAGCIPGLTLGWLVASHSGNAMLGTVVGAVGFVVSVLIAVYRPGPMVLVSLLAVVVLVIDYRHTSERDTVVSEAKADAARLAFDV